MTEKDGVLLRGMVTPAQKTRGQSVEAVEEVVVSVCTKLASESNSTNPTLVSSYYIFNPSPTRLCYSWTEPDQLFPLLTVLC